MKQIYDDIISEGETGLADEVGSNAYISADEIRNMIELFPEMLSVLKEYVDAEDRDDPYYVKEMRTAVKTKDYRKSANILFMAIDIINKAEGVDV